MAEATSTPILCQPLHEYNSVEFQRIASSLVDVLDELRDILRKVEELEEDLPKSEVDLLYNYCFNMQQRVVLVANAIDNKKCKKC